MVYIPFLSRTRAVQDTSLSEPPHSAKKKGYSSSDSLQSMNPQGAGSNIDIALRYVGVGLACAFVATVLGTLFAKIGALCGGASILSRIGKVLTTLGRSLYHMTTTPVFFLLRIVGSVLTAVRDLFLFIPRKIWTIVFNGWKYAPK